MLYGVLFCKYPFGNACQAGVMTSGRAGEGSVGVTPQEISCVLLHLHVPELQCTLIAYIQQISYTFSLSLLHF